MFLLGNIGQQLDIHDQEHELVALRARLAGQRTLGERTDEAVGRLVKENGELKLYLAALIKLLQSKGTISTEEIATMVKVLDEEDGRADGRFGGSLGPGT